MSSTEAANLLLDDLAASLIERLAPIVAAAAAPAEPASPWMNVESAAYYLDTTQHAIRGLIKRREIPHHRTPQGRIIFDRAELDDWVRGCTP